MCQPKIPYGCNPGNLGEPDLLKKFLAGMLAIGVQIFLDYVIFGPLTDSLIQSGNSLGN